MARNENPRRKSCSATAERSGTEPVPQAEPPTLDADIEERGEDPNIGRKCLLKMRPYADQIAVSGVPLKPLVFAWLRSIRTAGRTSRHSARVLLGPGERIAPFVGAPRTSLARSAAT